MSQDQQGKVIQYNGQSVLEITDLKRMAMDQNKSHVKNNLTIHYKTEK